MPSDKDRKNRNEGRGNDENRDPISGAPGAHPVGTGIGAAAGGAAGAIGAAAAAGAAGGTVLGGPVGTAAGAVVGAIVGGLAGKGIAEKVNPTAEDAYWREQHTREPYYDRNYTYDDYQGAYRTGYEGYGKWGAQGKTYQDVEPELRREYERNYAKSRLGWEKAQHATRAAWSRFDRDLSQYIGYDVVDRNDSKIGTLECLWSDHTGEPAFVGVRTGWLFGKNHVVPAHSVHVSQRKQCIRLPYDKERVKDAPAFDADTEIDEARENEVHRYYGTQAGSAGRTQTGAACDTPGKTSMGRESQRTSMQLSEEQVKVGKREVEAGGVRLRKVIRTETVNQPVTLKREEIVIERVPADKAQSQTGKSKFSEDELYIPLRREEAVVEKETRVREEVRARKETRTDEQQISENVRREDVEIEETGEARRSKRTPAEEIRERGEVPRSQRRRE
jgi:uncharacterized protein (TIGR02271 family)